MNLPHRFLRDADPYDLRNQVDAIWKFLRKLKLDQVPQDVQTPPAEPSSGGTSEEQVFDPNCVVVTDSSGHITTDTDLEYPPSGYGLGSELASGTVNANNESGVEITGLTIGNWYAIEATGGPKTGGPQPPYIDAYDFNLSLDGSAWSGRIGQGQNGTDPTLLYFLTLPSFGAFAEWVDALHGRVYFQATTTSVWFRNHDNAGAFADDLGTLGYVLSNASYGVKQITLHDVEYTQAKLPGAIHAASLKATPVDDDEVGIWDSVTGELRKALKSSLGGATSGAAGGDLTGTYPSPTVNIDGKTDKATPADGDETFLADSAASFATKKLSWANLKATLKTYFDAMYIPTGGGWTQVVDEDGSSFTHFTNTSGIWSSDGTVIKQTDASAVPMRARYNTFVMTNSVVYEAEVQLRSAGANRNGGLIIQYNGTNAGGIILFLNQGGSISVENDYVAARLSVSATVNTNTWYKVRAVVFGALISFYLDGVLKGTAYAPGVASASSIGLYSYQAEVWWRNIKAWNLALPA